MSETTTRVRAYLDELDHELRHMPRAQRQEIVRDVSQHIDAAIEDLGEPSEAGVEMVLDGLGTPYDIARAAYEELPPEKPRIRAREITTVILLLVGGLLVPLIGWVVGVVLLWTSNAWRTRDKWIGTLLFPGGLLGGLILFGLSLLAVSSSQCSSIPSGVAAEEVTGCTSSGGLDWPRAVVYFGLLAASTIGPIFTTFWLIRTARRER